MTATTPIITANAIIKKYVFFIFQTPKYASKYDITTAIAFAFEIPPEK